MGSTPLNQSDNEPSEDTEPAAAAAQSGDGPGRPMHDDEPEAVPSDKAADAADESKDDTQELSREEVTALISADNEARDDAEETDRAIDVSSGADGSHANRAREDELPVNSVDKTELAGTQLSHETGCESAGIQLDDLGTAEAESFESDEQQPADVSQRAGEESPHALSPKTPTADQTGAGHTVFDPATVRKWCP